MHAYLNENIHLNYTCKLKSKLDKNSFVIVKKAKMCQLSEGIKERSMMAWDIRMSKTNPGIGRLSDIATKWQFVNIVETPLQIHVYQKTAP